MSAVKMTIAAVVASLFGNSEKALSEKLSTEEFNKFSADAQAAHDQIETLQGEKKTAEDKVTELTTRAEAAEGELKTKTDRVTALEGSLKTAEEDRDKYKGWFDDKKEAGKGKPSEDATNKSVTTEGLADYNAGALAHFRKANGL